MELDPMIFCGQLPKDDFVVVTYSSRMVGQWEAKVLLKPLRSLPSVGSGAYPTNHIWIFSTRKAVTSVFAAFDALCEEGTATTVCRALDEVAGIAKSKASLWTTTVAVLSGHKAYYLRQKKIWARDEEGDLDKESLPSSPTASAADTIPKAEGLIVFFPGLPVSATSAFDVELLNCFGSLVKMPPLKSNRNSLLNIVKSTRE
ncbi:putative 2',3'-cyclic-nucleotide 3'-phosphodiesterase [Rosa chinensis]|uniref:Putative 2',3'-cyclic-nucleotide 3'-phosphodiesterase n=1 Tax=Rosa chinensis TaxID=74649 RepID=A0A2P6RG12_ROSCH|nr:putative 2',3'-cyclic-nucleotide 3'-phosphodiesterase [Rosa chinensis]